MILLLDPRSLICTATDPGRLVAQATCERLTIVSTDRALGDYDVPILW